LIAMLLDDYYQQILHAPVAPPSGEVAPAPAPPARRKPPRSGGRRRR
jgi:hypothetical protein